MSENLYRNTKIDLDSKIPLPPPQNFLEMLEGQQGTAIQKLLRFYIYSKNPDMIILACQLLQVDKFQQLMIRISSTTSKDGQFSNYKTNYTLGNLTTERLIQFATIETLVNELIHLVQLPYNAIFIHYSLEKNLPSFAFANLLFFTFNTYCVLAQKYTRARLTKTIDARIRKKKFPSSDFSNPLALRLPQSE